MRLHMPIQGPQALAKTLAPMLLNVLIILSRSMVWRTISEPGVMVNSAFVFKRSAATCAAKLAAREISSYDELVHEPINPTSTLVGQLFFAAASFIFEIGVAKSGVKGPFKCGSNSDRLISITWSKYFSGFLYTSGSAVRHFLILLAKAATSARPVARR